MRLDEERHHREQPAAQVTRARTEREGTHCSSNALACASLAVTMRETSFSGAISVSALRRAQPRRKQRKKAARTS